MADWGDNERVAGAESPGLPPRAPSNRPRWQGSLAKGSAMTPGPNKPEGRDPAVAAGFGEPTAPAPVTVNYRTPLPHDQGAVRVVRQVAEGEKTTVYEVVDNQRQCTMAMKVLKPDAARDPEARRRLIREAQVTAQLDHPHIPPVYQLGSDAHGNPYFTTKLVRGRPWSAVLGEPRPGVSAEQRLCDDVDTFLKVCDAVTFAHARGVIHRRISTDTIIVGGYGEVHLVGWDAARLASDTNPAGTGLLADDEQADESTDVFLLGAVLYRVVTRLSAAGEASSPELMARVGQSAVPSPDRAQPVDYPPQLCRITMKALAQEKGARYASVADLQKDLRDFLRSAWRLPRVVFAPGNLILREGQQGRDAYVIIQGHCQVFKTIAGRKLVLRQMGPGDVFGETAVFTNQPRSASVEALDEVGALVITREDLEHGMGMSHWLTPFVRTLAERFREVDARRVELEVRADTHAA